MKTLILEKRKAYKKIRSSVKKSKFRFRDEFGHIYFFKGILMTIIGIFSYRRLNLVNKLKVSGIENLKNLPDENVLFVSNHLTYFMDVMALYHVFFAQKSGMKNINNPLYLFNPRGKTYYIAAEETMKDGGILPKIFTFAGAVLVKRAWRHKGKDVKRSSDVRAPAKIKKALNSGWVINFPQGTTGKNAPVRKGSASLIKSFRPIVVAVSIAGFDEAFDKKGLKYRKKGTNLSIKFAEPIQFEEGTDLEEIQAFLEVSIGNS